MDRKLLEALRLVQGRGQMSAKDKYGWHPPLEDDGDAMPNQPRDIRNLDKAPEPFLPGKTGADFGQDQFGTPSPNAEKMAKAVGALRLPPVVAPEPTSMKDLMGLPASAGEDLVDPRGDAKTQSIAQNHPGHMVVSVDPSSYFGDEQGDKEIMSKASAIPYTMPKAQRQAFKGPTSHDPFQMGSAEDPNAGTDPWLAHPQASEGPAGPQPESSDSSNSGDLSGVGEYPESIPMDDMTDDIDVDTGAQPESNPGASNPEQPAVPEQSELQKYIAEMNGKGAQAEDRRDSSFLDSQQKMNSDMGLYKLLFASANKIGSHAGQQSSDEPFNSFADGAIKSNDKRSELLTKDRATQKKAGDDKLKALMFMDKQKQDKEKYTSDLAFRGEQLKELTHDKDEGRKVQRESNDSRNAYLAAALNAQMGNNAGRLALDHDRAEWDKNKGEGELGLKGRKIDADIAIAGSEQGLKGKQLEEQTRANKAREKNAREAARIKAVNDKKTGANLDPFVKKQIETLAGKTAQAKDSLSNFDAFLKAFDSAGSESEKINYAMANLKTLQSMEGPDAINGSDEPRLVSYLQSIRPREALRSGGKIFGTDIPKFRADIQRRIDQIKSRINSNVIEGDKLRNEGSSIKAGVDAKAARGTDAALSGKVRVRDTKTGETFTIDEDDLDEALSEDNMEQI